MVTVIALSHCMYMLYEQRICSAGTYLQALRLGMQPWGHPLGAPWGASPGVPLRVQDCCQIGPISILHRLSAIEHVCPRPTLLRYMLDSHFSHVECT